MISEEEIDQEKYDFYQSLREKVNVWLKSGSGKKHKYAKYIMWAPDLFHLLLKLSLDKDVSSKNKAKLAATIVYFISPIDLIPEGLIGPVGYIDDIALAAYTLNSIINETDSTLVEEYWAGDEDVIIVIEQIIAFANNTLSTDLIRKLRDKL